MMVRSSLHNEVLAIREVTLGQGHSKGLFIRIDTVYVVEAGWLDPGFTMKRRPSEE